MLCPAMNSIHIAAMSLGIKLMVRESAIGDTGAPRARMNEDFRRVCGGA